MVKEKNHKKMATVIIPAYNEELTIAQIVGIALKNKHISEVLVIDDGSTDNTGRNALSAGAKVISLPENRGKAEAMQIGVTSAKNNVVCFVDADLIGFSTKHLSILLEPVLSEKADMNIAIRKRKNFLINKIIRVFPLIGGERALTKTLWESVPIKYKKRFEIEIALNYFAKKNKFKTKNFYMPGVNQLRKEEKHGLIRGFYERLLMIRDILIISFDLYIIDKTADIFKSLSNESLS